VKFKRETEFQETEIGKIPREWRIVRLIEVAEIRGSKKLPENVKSVVFIPMEAVPDNSLYVNYVVRNADEVKSYVYCEPGDLLVAKITPSFENGKQGIVPYDLPGKFALATTEVYPIKCNNIDKLFLFYILKYPPIRGKLASLMRGTTGRRRLPREALENTLLPYPPIHEQRRIAEILSTVDRAIELYREERIRLDRLKRGLMDLLLTGKIRVVED
jgi:type I restriction enzyme S subunit